MTYLTVKSGKVEIYTSRDFNAPPAFVAITAEEAANYLLDHNILDWSNSSSMDFGTEHGWHCDGVCDEIVAEMEGLPG